MVLAAAGNTAFAGQIIYVDADANGLNDGTSWKDAYRFLQDALTDANDSEKPVEIRVAQGTYKPDEDTLHPGGTGNRESTFQLINGVTLKGVYAGFGEPDPNARDNVLYQTILSGNIGKPLDKNDNCYHIFYHPEGLNLDDTSILDGFTITGGSANNSSWPHNRGGGIFNNESSPNVNNCNISDNSAIYGGGMFNYESSPNVNNCTFTDNSAYDGGGMYNEDSSPTVNNCTFTGNSANEYGGGMLNWYNSPTVEGCTFSGNSAVAGGGMDNEDSSPTVNNCTFTANSADLGGGMCNFWNSRPTVTNCTFIANSATRYGGGGMSNYSSSPTVNNCTFSGNSAEWNGGGMFNVGSSPIITNCTFSGNVAKEYGGGMCNYRYSSPTVSNSILWADVPSEISGGTPTVRYSDVQGGWPGEGNLNKNPCFADPNNGDYHLKSQAGRCNPNSKSWVKDDVTSPCIDAGDPESPIGLEPFPNGGIINIGAYGGTAEASKSYFGEPPCETIVAGDINGDCIVNLKDFALMAFHWLEEY
jgi:hypothetical protein